MLGHYFEGLVRSGAVKDYAEIARRTGLTRARVTQIVDMTLLSPYEQEQLLSWTPVGHTDNATLLACAITSPTSLKVS